MQSQQIGLIWKYNTNFKRKLIIVVDINNPMFRYSSLGHFKTKISIILLTDTFISLVYCTVPVPMALQKKMVAGTKWESKTPQFSAYTHTLAECWISWFDAFRWNHNPEHKILITETQAFITIIKSDEGLWGPNLCTDYCLVRCGFKTGFASGEWIWYWTWLNITRHISHGCSASKTLRFYLQFCRPVPWFIFERL